MYASQPMSLDLIFLPASCRVLITTV